MRFNKNGSLCSRDIKKVVKQINKIYHGPLVRVEFEYEDGDINRLTGKDAQEWLNAVNGQIQIANMHGFGLQKFKWKSGKKKDYIDLLQRCLRALMWLEDSGDTADVERNVFIKRVVTPLLKKIMKIL